MILLPGKRLFGTAGIRGRYNTEITPTLAVQVANALSKGTRDGRATTGMDCRQGAPPIKAALESGLLSHNWTIRDLHITPTPVLAYGTRERRCDYGLMVTASHNPPEYIGIKVFNSEGMEIPEQEEDIIQRRIEDKEFPLSSWNVRGSITRDPSTENSYVKDLVEHTTATHEMSLRVLVDCSNGPVTSTISKILSETAHRFVLVNSHADGSFPGRLPEPTLVNLSQTAASVKQLGLDLGLAFDGDGDRLAIIDEKGRLVDVHTVAATYIKHRLRETGKRDVVASVDSSKALRDVVEGHGGKLLLSRLGKTFVTVKDQGALIGTEPWKIVDANWGFWEDGIFAAAKILQWLSTAHMTSSEFFAEVPQYPHVRTSFRLNSREEGASKLERIVDELGKAAYDTVRIDGVKMLFDEKTWLLVRVSGTEYKLRIYAESDTQQKLNRLVSRAVRAGELGGG